MEDIIKYSECVHNQTFFITITNYGYIPYTINMLKSLNKFNVDKQILIICLDKDSFLFLENLGYQVYLFNIDIREFNIFKKNKDFGYIRYIKFKILHKIISLGYNVLYSDSDIVYLKNPIEKIVIWENMKVDVIIQNDGEKNNKTNNLCVGFIFIKSNEKTIENFEIKDHTAFEGIKNGKYPIYDQTYFNKYISKNLIINILPLELYPNGIFFIRNCSKLNNLELVHFNWISGDEKYNKMLKYKMWLVDNKIPEYKKRVINYYLEYDIYNPEFVFGIGDYLRGCMSLYYICKNNNWEFIADYSKHSIFNFVDNKLSNPVETEEKKIKNFFLCDNLNKSHYNQIYSYLVKNRDYKYVSTNLFQIKKITEDCREFMKKSFKPNDILETEIQKYMNEFQIKEKEYICLHIRMGDEKLVSGDDISSKYERVKNKIIKMVEIYGSSYKVIVFSDDPDMKKYLNQNCGYLYLNTKSCHLGMKGNNLDDVRDTLVDFFILSRCYKIILHSELSHGSGFSHWCSQIYNIEVIK